MHFSWNKIQSFNIVSKVSASKTKLSAVETRGVRAGVSKLLQAGMLPGQTWRMWGRDRLAGKANSVVPPCFPEGRLYFIPAFHISVLLNLLMGRLLLLAVGGKKATAGPYSIILQQRCGLLPIKRKKIFSIPPKAPLLTVSVVLYFHV